MIMRYMKCLTSTKTPSAGKRKSILKEMKNGKAPGIDNIFVELLKVDINMQYDLLVFTSTWDKEEVLKD
jgi:hypothetical protein